MRSHSLSVFEGTTIVEIGGDARGAESVIAHRRGNAGVSSPALRTAMLKAADLVSERRDGTRRLYQARQDEMRKLRAFLDDYWTTGLERLRDVAEAAQRDKGATDGRAHP